MTLTPDATTNDDDGSGETAEEELVYGESPARLGERLLAYLLDSVVLFAFTMFFAVASFLNIFLRSDHGRDTAGDSAIYQSSYILLLTVPAWFALNLLVTSRKAHTVGQYVMGLRLRDGNGESAPRSRRLALYWVALHPLLFHPFFIGFWAFFGYVALVLSDSTIVFLVGSALGLMCALAPLANLGFCAFDKQHRTVSDLLANVRLARLD
jgi:uncharacterized RDD family membrane protein YckC